MCVNTHGIHIHNSFYTEVEKAKHVNIFKYFSYKCIEHFIFNSGWPHYISVRLVWFLVRNVMSSSLTIDVFTINEILSITLNLRRVAIRNPRLGDNWRLTV